MFIELLYEKLPIILQNKICSLKGYQLKKQRYTKKFFERLDFLMKSSLWNKTQITEYQLYRLNKLLDFSIKTVPYYRNLYKKGKIPEKIMALEELKEFPIIEKKALKTDTTSFTTTDKSKHYIKNYTSGTTGTSLQLRTCEEGLNDIFAMLWRQRKQFGVEFGDATATFNGRLIVPHHQTKPPFWRHNFFLNQTLFSQYHASKRNLRYYISALNDGNYQLWFGYPSFIGLIANVLEYHDLKLESHPTLVQTGSETLLPIIRKRIERNVGLVRDNYGCTEGCVSISECKYGKLHVDNEMSIIEVEKFEEDDRYVTGQLIVTGLSNYAMPLIRYRIGDIGTMCKFDCRCGRPGPIFTKIDGRVEDFIVTPQGRFVGRMDHLFKNTRNIEECQIVQNDVDKITLNLVKAPHYTMKDEKNLRKKIEKFLGADIAPVFNYVDEIPRLKNGKFRAVINNVNPDSLP